MKARVPYPFNVTEQDAIRFAGVCGYRFTNDTKYVIAFYNDKRHDWLYFNRKAEGTNFVIALKGRPLPSSFAHAEIVSNSNFRKLPKGPTSRSKVNHQGHQFCLPHASHLPDLLRQLNGTVP
jgi:hypothetical protein